MLTIKIVTRMYRQGHALPPRASGQPLPLIYCDNWPPVYLSQARLKPETDRSLQSYGLAIGTTGIGCHTIYPLSAA